MADRQVETALDELAQGGLRLGALEAWELFECAWPLILGRLNVFLRSLQVPQDLREDCGQAVLLRVWRGRAGYRGSGRSAFLAWVHQICRREHLRLLEARARAPHALGDLTADDGDEMALIDRQGSEDGNPVFESAEQADTHRALEECVGALEPKHREVIELIYAEQSLTERDAAAVLERSKSHIHILRREALSQLERCLQGKGELPE